MPALLPTLATSTRNREAIRPGVQCGCYFCLTVFDGGTVKEWADGGETALCPRCGIDAVLSGETDIDVLSTLHERGFCQDSEPGPNIER